MKHLVLLSAIVTLLVMQDRAAGQQVYWLESTFNAPKLRRANADGTGRRAVALPAGSLPQAMSVDGKSGLLYWTSRRFAGARIFRGNTAFSGIDTIPNPGGESTLRGVGVVGGMLYWTSTNLLEGNRIRRGNVDGSSEETLIAFPAGGRESLRSIALDVPAGKMYWADPGLGMIRRANLNGTGLQNLLMGLQGPVGVAIDSAGKMLYWSEAIGGTIKRANLDGSSPSTLVSGIPGVQSISLHAKNAMMYWTEIGPGGSGRIKKATLDGNNVSTIAGALQADSVRYPQGIVVLDSGLTSPVAGNTPPAAFALEQNFPNPFNPTTQIRYAVAGTGGQGIGDSHVRLVVYDLLGREVAVLVNEKKEPGNYTVRLYGTGLASGVYLYRLQAGSFVATRRLLVLR